MSDFFTLEPDELEPERPERRTPPRLVSTGLHPLEDVPQARRKAKDAPPAYAPCEACGQPVLIGETRAGKRLALHVHVRTYAVSWDKGVPLPRLDESRAYPLHGCRATGVELSELSV